MSIEFYSRPTFMSGGLYRVYAGSRPQHGSGILSNIRSYMAPLGSTALRGLKSVARNKTFRQVAKKAAEKGAEVLTGVAVDALQGEHIGESLKSRSRQAALETLVGPPSNNSRRKKLKQNQKSKKTKKRLPSATEAIKQPVTKKRRLKINRGELF